MRIRLKSTVEVDSDLEESETEAIARNLLALAIVEEPIKILYKNVLLSVHLDPSDAKAVLGESEARSQARTLENRRIRRRRRDRREREAANGQR